MFPPIFGLYLLSNSEQRRKLLNRYNRFDRLSAFIVAILALAIFALILTIAKQGV